MKFFIFTCLLAVALAKQKMEHVSSSEEPINISQETYKQEKNIAIDPSKEKLCTTSCEEVERNANEEEYSIRSSSEESAEVATEDITITVDDKHYQKALNEINQFYQKFPQYLQYLYQGPIVLNPWDQVKRNAGPFPPTVNREQLSTSEENSKKTVDMESTEVFTKKTKLTEEEKNRLNFLKKISQYYQKFAWPQYLKTVYQHQKAMKPWTQPKTNAIPYVDYSDNIGSPYPVNPSASIPYPVNPSASIPYPMPDSDFPPPVYLTKTNFPNYPRNPDPDTAVPANPLVFTVLGAPLYSIASLPISPFSGQPPPTGVFRLVPASRRPTGPFYPPNEAAPSADNTYIVEILVPPTTPPPTTPPPTVPDVQPLTITEPDEAEPAAAAHAAPEPQSSISFDQE
ncbi:proline-rich protein 27 [Oryx dammah]|uniref:proline-rich protein 27 n=1 Tax=Oryx dammah TaxID=59534 RepID=UPI001A9B3E7F|nr:proline-rich protein 27 [Oryx dammah]